jgi:thiol-disulfide isomerase/thioredoxin
MRNIFFTIFLLWQSTIVFCQSGITTSERKVFSKELLSSFPLQQPSGNNASLKFSSTKLLVFVFLSPECPLSKNYSSKLSEIKKKYDSQVSFVGIIPGKFEAEQVSEFQKKYLPGWTIYRDNSLQLTHYLEGSVTPEVIVMNNQNGFLVYKGAIDDWVVSLGKTRQHYANFYLDNALSDFLNNKKILTAYHKPVGCFINDF